MPWNPDGSRKKSALYKKSKGFQMKSKKCLKCGKRPCVCVKRKQL